MSDLSSSCVPRQLLQFALVVTTVLVVDASAVIELLLGTSLGRKVGEQLVGDGRGEHTLHAPELLGVEIASVLRRLRQADQLDEVSAMRVLSDLDALGVEMYAHQPLLSRALALYSNVTAYDAVYVALAEGLGADLLTCDAKLGRAIGHRAKVKVVQ